MGHTNEYFIPACPSLADVRARIAEYKPRGELIAACHKTLEVDPDNGGCLGVLDFAARYERNFGGGATP